MRALILAISRSPKSRRRFARLGLAALVLNEVRGIVTVAATSPLWWPVLTSAFHAAMRGR